MNGKPYQLRIEGVEVDRNLVKFRFGIYFVNDPQAERSAQAEETEVLELPEHGLRVGELGALAESAAFRLARRLARRGGYTFQL